MKILLTIVDSDGEVYKSKQEDVDDAIAWLGNVERAIKREEELFIEDPGPEDHIMAHHNEAVRHLNSQ